MDLRRRLERVTSVLKALSVDYILQLEKRDPQYRAVCRVVDRHGEVVGARLALYNALVSYRLLGKGEEHWSYFGDYFSRDIFDVCKDFIKYLESSPYLKLGLEARKRRVLKVCNYIPDVENLTRTLAELSSLLNASPSQKTLVFAVKILNYVYMCSRKVDRLLPFDIPIPVDYRVAYLTWCSGLTDMAPQLGMKMYRDIQNIWGEISRRVGIPPLHLDTLLWLAGRAVLYGENIHGIPREVIEVFSLREECRTPSRQSLESSEA